MSKAQSRFVEITILRNKRTSRLIAVCKDIEGFIAQGKNIAELKERIPPLMEKLLLLRGEKITKIDLVESIKDSPSNDYQNIDDGFVEASLIAQAQIYSNTQSYA